MKNSATRRKRLEFDFHAQQWIERYPKLKKTKSARKLRKVSVETGQLNAGKTKCMARGGERKGARIFFKDLKNLTGHAPPRPAEVLHEGARNQKIRHVGPVSLPLTVCCCRQSRVVDHLPSEEHVGCGTLFSLFLQSFSFSSSQRVHAPLQMGSCTPVARIYISVCAYIYLASSFGQLSDNPNEGPLYKNKDKRRTTCSRLPAMMCVCSARAAYEKPLRFFGCRCKLKRNGGQTVTHDMCTRIQKPPMPLPTLL